MKINFIPLDIDYEDDNQGVTWVRIFGRDDQGKQVCVLDTCDSFFYLIPKEGTNLKEYVKKIEKVETEVAGRKARVIRAEVVNKNFMGKPVEAIKVYVSNHKDVQAIKDIVKNFPETEDKQETDISFVTRYLLEKKLKILQWHEVEGEKIEEEELKAKGLSCLRVDLVLRAEKIKLSKNQKEFTPKVIAFDIEASEFEIGKGKILMISVANEKLRKIFTWKKFKDPPEEVEFVDNEQELIEKFLEIIKEEKPDCIVGYFSDGFDLPYLRERAEKLKVKLGIGLDNTTITFVRGIISSAKISGIVHIDLFKFIDNIISPSLKLETLTLDEVAKELIGEEKLKIDLRKITKQLETKDHYDTEMKRFCLYNLQDAILTAKLFIKLWPNIAELTKIANEPLWVTSRATYSSLVEHYIIHNLEKFNEIIKRRPTREEIEARRRAGKYAGAFVLEPKPGLYENIAMFDFRSLYPSIIVSFNISPSTLLDKKEKDCYATPEFELDGKKRIFYFKKELGFIPALLLELINARKKVKQELKKHRTPLLEARDYSLKTICNATYGYFAFFGARWYSRECAASITALGRYYIQKVIEDAKKEGFNVLYADTDSVALQLGKFTEKYALDWKEKINEQLPGEMELELEAFYKRGIFVTTRKGEIGAKKKYAMLSQDGTLKIRGFETVRRDWAKLTKEVQDKVLRFVLQDGNPWRAVEYVRKVIEELKAKKIPKEELVIKTQVKKELQDYEAITPHVTIAKRMQQMGLPIKVGTIVEYIVTEGKTRESLVRERVKLPDECEEKEYDSSYYIEHQILPAVENIFEIFGVSREDLLGKKQKRLMEF